MSDYKLGSVVFNDTNNTKSFPIANFLATLLANLISIVIICILVVVFVVPYIEHKNDLIHQDITDFKSTISASADKVATSIGNFHIFGTKH